jgi:outer membrane immunogenic protein
LLYGGGGAAWVRDHHVELDLGAPFARGGDVTRSGWVVLGGLEWMFAPNWSLFVQYDFMDFGTHTDPLVLVTGGPHTFDIKQHVQAALVGINFRFGGPPLGARY